MRRDLMSGKTMIAPPLLSQFFQRRCRWLRVSSRIQDALEYEGLSGMPLAISSLLDPVSGKSKIPCREDGLSAERDGSDQVV